MTVASFIATQRTDHGVPHATSCRALEVPESTFYKWLDRPPTPSQARQVRLDEAVKASFDDSGGNAGTYGSPRVFEDLIEDGWVVSVNTVAGSMRRQGLEGRARRRRGRSLTRPDKAAAPIRDLIGRDFSAEAINEKWCGDLTEIPTDEGKLYLATVEDLASRRLPGFAIGEHHDAGLARAALCMAAAVRGGNIRGVIFHSDKGGEYTGDTFAKTCKALGGGPVDGPGRVGIGQRCCGEFQLDPRVRVVVASALRHQGPGPQRGRRVHRHLQPPAPPQQLRDETPRRLRTDPRRQSRPTGPGSMKNRDFTAVSMLSETSR